jgi:hypothetical protein
VTKTWVAGECAVSEGREVVQKLQVNHVKIATIMPVNVEGAG